VRHEDYSATENIVAEPFIGNSAKVAVLFSVVMAA